METSPPRLGVGVHLYPCYLSTHAILSIKEKYGEKERRGQEMIGEESN